MLRHSRHAGVYVESCLYAALANANRQVRPNPLSVARTNALGKPITRSKSSFFDWMSLCLPRLSTTIFNSLKFFAFASRLLYCARYCLMRTHFTRFHINGVTGLSTAVAVGGAPDTVIVALDMR